MHSGHVLPANGAVVKRRDGVGILLSRQAFAAWKAAGKVWRAESPCIVSARLKLAPAGQHLAGGLRRSHDVFATVVYVNALTFCAPGDRIKCFYEDLQDVLNGIAHKDM